MEADGSGWKKEVAGKKKEEEGSWAGLREKEIKRKEKRRRELLGWAGNENRNEKEEGKKRIVGLGLVGGKKVEKRKGK